MAEVRPGPVTIRLPKVKMIPHSLRFVPVKGRYILQEKLGEHWRNVPLVTSGSAAVAT
jgi:hypothetical protein